MNDAAAATLSATAAHSAAELLGSYLAERAGVFLRSLPLPSADAPEAERLPAALRRVGAVLHTFEPLLDRAWAEPLRTELGWLTGVVTAETAQVRRLTRLLAALDALTATGAEPEPGAQAAAGAPAIPRPAGGDAGPLRAPQAGLLAGHPGVAKARALVERQLTVSRSRARTAALQELGSARFHALADTMTLLASEPPITAAGDSRALLPYLGAAYRDLVASVQALPLVRCGHPYNGDALHRLASAVEASAEEAPPRQGPAPVDGWGTVRVLAARARYALELCAPVLGGAAAEPSDRLTALSRLLSGDRDAADAAGTAAAAARTPRITPATAYVLGVLHADQRLEVEAARYAFSRQWPELLGTEWHRAHARVDAP